MIAEKLRKSILQAAIQGKLTEQLPEDGDARDLLEEIKTEKDRLIKEGNLKREKLLPEIIENEIPFEIPDNWCWVRLGDIVQINPRNKIDDDTMVSFMPMTLLDDVYSNRFSYEERLWKQVKSGFTHFANNDVVVAKITPCFQNRKSAVMKSLINGFGAGTTELHVLRPINNLIDSEYILYLVKTEYFIGDGVLNMTGTAGQQRVGKEYFQNLFFPLPPKCEQFRIVSKIDELLSEIKTLYIDELKLNLLQKSFPKKMKDSLLQAAIQGKLTEQLESDGNSRGLVSDIQKEKERLIKEGKIKKEKALPEITEDEEPFDIPENWCWVRLGEIITLKSGQDMTPDKYSSINKGIPYITGASNFVDGVLNIDRWTPVPRSIADEGDLLITCKGTVGDMAFLKHSSAHIARQVMAIKPLVGVDIRYIKIYLSFYVNELKSRAKSMIPGISREIILGSLLPLPPFNEQVRIVERLEQLLPLCDSLE